MPEDTGYPASGATDTEKNKLLASFEKQLKRCEKNWREEFQAIDRSRRLLQGEIPDSVPHHSDGVGIVNASGEPFESGYAERQKVRANLLLATNEAMLPLVYARNPDVSVKPAEKVGGQGPEYHNTKGWAETLELVVSKQLAAGGLKKQAKKAVRSVQAAKIGWLKVTYQQDYGTDSEILNRMNDVQENLAEIEGRIRALAEDDPSIEAEELAAQQLRQMIASLENSPEVVTAEGIVVDHIPTDNMRVLGVKCLEDYTQAHAMGHYVELPVDEYRHRFQVDEDGMKGVTVFTERPSGNGVETRAYASGHVSGDREEFVRLWELWQRTDNTVYTWAQGAMDFCREPWTPSDMPERWYPFWCIGFHWIDGVPWPESSVDLLEGLQQEYNDCREQKNEHRRANVPHYIASADAEPDTVRSFSVAGAREVVLIDAGGRPLNEIFAPSPGIPLNPAMYATDDTRFDMQWVSGVQDAARGGVTKAKTLGEAEIAENHLASRASNFQDELEDVLTEISIYVAQLCLLKMAPKTVIKIAGENAVWPNLPREDVFDLFDIEIRAGSTGKPDQRAEREQWAELLPHVVELIGKIMEMRQDRLLEDGSMVPGIRDEVNPYVKILEETLKRFDERIDLEQFLPPQQPPQQPQQPGLGAMAPGPGQGNVTGFPQQQPMIG